MAEQEQFKETIARHPLVIGPECTWGEASRIYPFYIGEIKYLKLWIKFTGEFERIYFDKLKKVERNSGVVTFTEQAVHFYEGVAITQRKFHSFYSWDKRDNMLIAKMRELNSLNESLNNSLIGEKSTNIGLQIMMQNLTESQGVNILFEKIREIMREESHNIIMAIRTKKEL